MDIFKRDLNLPELLQKKSFFLLGPRATGKSYLIHQQLGNQALILDLLRSDLYLQLSANPSELENIIAAAKTSYKYIVLDEIQKIPALLDEVHRLIEAKRIRFLLTGSSARKLKRGGTNLLAGRAWSASLYPLSFSEIPNFNLDRFLQFGGLPAIYSSEYPQEELNAYVQTYLREEVQAEGLIRKMPPFSRFLIVAALMNGKLLNFAQLANDTTVPATTIREYYSILEDTLVGFQLEPWTRSKKRKAISTAKFYFFDTGVTHTLAQTQSLDRNSDLYGRSFEHWVGMELRSYLSYRRLTAPLAFWQSTHQQEVDFVIDDHTAIEVKATRKITPRDLKGLQALQEEKVFKNFFLISQDPIEAKYGKILCLPWKKFMELLWADSIL